MSSTGTLLLGNTIMMVAVGIIAATSGPDPQTVKTNYLPDVTNGWSSIRVEVPVFVVKESKIVVTNVVETSDESGCAVCEQLRKNPGILIYHEFNGCKPYHPATWKLTTTTVKEVWTLTYKWRDKEWTQTDEKVLDRTFKKVTKQDQWVDAQPTAADTNQDKSVIYWNGQPIYLYPQNSTTGSIAMTNLILFGTNPTMRLNQ